MTSSQGLLISQSQFNAYAAEGYNRIPLVREVLADLDTPLSTYRKLADGPYSYLFESVQGGETWGRYSIIGLGCEQRFEVRGHTVSLFRGDLCEQQTEVADPLQAVDSFYQQFRVPKIAGLPRFSGGLVGYFGYETVAYIEPRLQRILTKPDTIGAADILLMVSDDLVVFDNLRGALFVITHVQTDSKASESDNQQAYQRGVAHLDALSAKLREAAPAITDEPSARPMAESDFISSFPQKDFEAAVAKIKEYVLAGDVMQTVPSQRLTAQFDNNPLDLYRALRYLNPSPYLFYLNLNELHVVGSSPEILVRMNDNEQGREVTVRPIAGTRRRGRNEADDLAMERDLLGDPKEVAEHLMLIDLGRNDVGRIAEQGSVELTDNMVVERYSHVMHIVSNVKAQVRDGTSLMDVLKATFPAGTLSGAPKIRAMEIIADLEPVKRGIYGGAVGYLGWNGEMDTAIAIRTAVIKDNQLHVQAGAGVVADSVPSLEWKETMNKGRAIFAAASMVANGLKPEGS